MSQHVLYFGKHKGQPLQEIPGDYLAWVLANVRLSSGLRAAVGDELRRRGQEPPPPPAPTWQPKCPNHPGGGITCHWREGSDGRKRVRAECSTCGRFIGHPPSQPPWSEIADANRSPTAELDVLLQAEAMNIELVSDGKSVWVRYEDGGKVSPGFRALLHQVSHSLALLLGDNRKEINP